VLGRLLDLLPVLSLRRHIRQEFDRSSFCSLAIALQEIDHQVAQLIRRILRQEMTSAGQGIPPARR